MLRIQQKQKLKVGDGHGLLLHTSAEQQYSSDAEDTFLRDTLFPSEESNTAWGPKQTFFLHDYVPCTPVMGPLSS